jgi:hypothetical protein
MNILKPFILAMIVAQPALAGNEFSVESNIDKVDKWKFHRVSVYRDADSVNVFGRMNASLYTRRPQGHIDVFAYSPEGILLEKQSVNYSPKLLSTRVKRKGGVKFNVGLSRNLPNGSVIKVSFHRNEKIKKRIHL